MYQMIVKDYYKILEVPPTASLVDIKKAFRKLAFKYHPDKNDGNAIYEQKFKEINEAYRVLSDTAKRNDYNYSRSTRNQYNNLRQQTASKFKDEILTVQSLVNEAKKIRSKTAAADPDRMNKKALFVQVEELLTRKNVKTFRDSHDPKSNAVFVECIFNISSKLPYSMVCQIIHPLIQIAGTDNDLLVKIYAFDKQVKYNTIWNEYKLAIAFIAALLFCILIYVIAD